MRVGGVDSFAETARWSGGGVVGRDALELENVKSVARGGRAVGREYKLTQCEM
jgi:hypothetical protein